MAQYGGGLPTLQIASSVPSARIQPQPMVPGPREFISLIQPRPGSNRKQNEYIDTPLRPQPSKTRLKEDRRNDGSLSDQEVPGIHRSFVRTGSTISTSARFNTHPVIVQPTTFKKDKYPETISEAEDHGDSIICRQCGKCKCDSCRNTRQLPSRWICKDKCLCSIQNAVNYCTCLCCVKGVFYHWAKDYDTDANTSCADHPCSCGPQHRCARWGCMSLMSLVLPCLCFYLPLNGCVKLCEVSYAKVTSRGCQCNPHRTMEQAPEKRLLDSNSDC